MNNATPAAICLAALTASIAPAQEPQPPAPQREFRGVWVATVDNIDWPSKPGLQATEQRRELDAILDVAAEMNLNAVILQVRPTADALYRSNLEPWSEWLTGTEGLGPKPKWDPLAHAVAAAHARGLELHAWFNPYRVRHPKAKSRPARNNVARRYPDMVVDYGDYRWIDPGHPRAADWSLGVILDVVQRYDIDGVHLDDYFYPYPIKGEEFPDQRSYRRYRKRGGKLERDDWRRHNVDEFIRRMYADVKAAEPEVVVGISPFGIARPGVPKGIEAGIDQYATLYADVQKWLTEGWCDYMSPQLYWPIDQTPQSFAKLLSWWADGVDNPHRRHIWPGLYTSAQAAMKKNWRKRELLEHIRLIREQRGADGHVHFSMQVFTDNTGGWRDLLAGSAYLEPAVVPATPPRDAEPPGAPRVELTRVGSAVSVAIAHAPESQFGVVQALRDGVWRTIELTGADVTEVQLPALGLEAVAVSSIDAFGVLSAATVRRP